MYRRTRLSLGMTACLIAPLIAGGGGGCGKSAAPETSAEAAKAASAKPAAEVGQGKSAAVERKIIYTAALDVVVKDLSEATRDVEKQLAAHKGRLARSETHSDSGARRTATFTLEVPVENFRELLGGLKELGTPERDSVDSQDVTEEYVDIQSRLKNLRQQEDKLNELLKEKRKEEKLEDVIRVSEKIYEVRQVIERAEGRAKYLEAKAAFSTITLTLREIKDYKPPTAPTFNNRVSRTFSGSWDAVVEFSEGVALVAVALVPWLPILIPAGLVGFWLLRKVWRVVFAPTLHPVSESHRRLPRATPAPPAESAGDAPADQRGN